MIKIGGEDMLNIDKKNNKSKAGGLAAGIAIGAALGATAVALKDKKTQAKVKNTVKKMKTWAEKTSNHFADRTQEVINGVEKEVESESN